MYTLEMRTMPMKSPSPRRAWIEIGLERVQGAEGAVALPTEGVD